MPSRRENWIITGAFPASFPRTMHLEFLRSFVFINIAGCTFIFVERDRGHGTRDTGHGPPVGNLEMEPCSPTPSRPGSGIISGIFRSFVFIHIAGCTFIFVE
jgi:hypothetical protein